MRAPRHCAPCNEAPHLCHPRCQAIRLLQKTQLCSAHFKDFDFQQLLDLVRGESMRAQGECRGSGRNPLESFLAPRRASLAPCGLHHSKLAPTWPGCLCVSKLRTRSALFQAHNLSIIEFKKDDTVFFQGEPATFFGVLLEGSLKPVAGGQQVGQSRVVGELLGEMALFTGGTRTASLIADADGHIACFQFSQLERLKSTNPGLAKKMNVQLASAALAKKYESKGMTLAQVRGAPLFRLVRLEG